MNTPLFLGRRTCLLGWTQRRPSKDSELNASLMGFALAPPTGQSWMFINFWPVHPFFTNDVSLEPLGRSKLNASLMGFFRHIGFSAIFDLIKNLKKASRHKFCLIFLKFGPDDLQTMTQHAFNFLKFKDAWLWQPIKLDGEVAKQEVSPFLSNPLTYLNQTWYIESWHHPGDT